jgi:hypothetical protein
MIFVAIRESRLRAAGSSRRASSRERGAILPVVSVGVDQRRGRDGKGIIPLDEENGRVRQGFTSTSDKIRRASSHRNHLLGIKPSLGELGCKPTGQNAIPDRHGCALDRRGEVIQLKSRRHVVDVLERSSTRDAGLTTLDDAPPKGGSLFG